FLDGGGVIAQQGDLLRDLPRFEGESFEDREIGYDLLEETAYPRYRGMLAATPDSIVTYADCFAALVPALQRSTVAFVDDPEPTLELIVELSARFGDPGYDAEAARAAFDVALAHDVLADGRTDA